MTKQYAFCRGLINKNPRPITNLNEIDYGTRDFSLFGLLPRFHPYSLRPRPKALYMAIV